MIPSLVPMNFLSPNLAYILLRTASYNLMHIYIKLTQKKKQYNSSLSMRCRFQLMCSLLCIACRHHQERTLEQSVIGMQHTFSAYVAELRERVSILEQSMQQQLREGNCIVPDSPNDQIETPPATQPPYFDFSYHQNETIPPSHYLHCPLYFSSNLPSHTPHSSPPLTPPPG